MYVYVVCVTLKLRQVESIPHTTNDAGSNKCYRYQNADCGTIPVEHHTRFQLVQVTNRISVVVLTDKPINNSDQFVNNYASGQWLLTSK